MSRFMEPSAPGVLRARAHFALLTALLVASAIPAAATQVVHVRVGEHPEFTRVVFELDGRAGYKLERKSGARGTELLVTLDASAGASRLTRRGSDVRQVEVAAGDHAVARIRLRKGDLALKELILSNPYRIVLDVMRDSPVATAKARPAPTPKPVAEGELSPETKPERKEARKVEPPKPALPKQEPTPEPKPQAKAESPPVQKPVAKAPEPAPAPKPVEETKPPAPKPEAAPKPIAKLEPPKAEPAPAPKPVAETKPPAPKPEAAPEPAPAPKPIAKLEPPKAEPAPAPKPVAETKPPAPPVPAETAKAGSPPPAPGKPPLGLVIPGFAPAPPDAQAKAAQPSPGVQKPPAELTPAVAPGAQAGGAPPTPPGGSAPAGSTPEPKPEVAGEKPGATPAEVAKLEKPAARPQPAATSKPAPKKEAKGGGSWWSNPLLLAGAGGALACVLAVAFLLRRRRALPNDLDVTAIAEGRGDDAADSAGAAFAAEEDESSFAGLFDDDTSAPTRAAVPPPSASIPKPTEPVPTGTPLDSLFDDDDAHGPPVRQGAAKMTPTDLPMDRTSMGSRSAPARTAAAGAAPAAGGDVMRMVQELERRIGALEVKLDQANEAREKLERQVAAQSEELRVQRAAIARTQRALRTMSRGDEEKATEPALREETQTKVRPGTL